MEAEQPSLWIEISSAALRPVERNKAAMEATIFAAERMSHMSFPLCTAKAGEAELRRGAVGHDWPTLPDPPRTQSSWTAWQSKGRTIRPRTGVCVGSFGCWEPG
jgi:hypothetical protein